MYCNLPAHPNAVLRREQITMEESLTVRPIHFPDFCPATTAAAEGEVSSSHSH